eukprot:1437850-Amphidinium_carterae.2
MKVTTKSHKPPFWIEGGHQETSGIWLDPANCLLYIERRFLLEASVSLLSVHLTSHCGKDIVGGGHVLSRWWHQGRTTTNVLPSLDSYKGTAAYI